MSDARRRSRMLRLTLAAIALLGIGAAITAAAWTDDVYFEANLDSGNLDLEGRVSDDGGNTWSEFEPSRDPANIALSVDFVDLNPGDVRTMSIEVRNQGTATALITGELDWVTGVYESGDCAVGVEVNPIPSGDIILTGGGATTGVYNFVFTVPSEWPNQCQDTADTFVLHVSGTTDLP